MLPSCVCRCVSVTSRCSTKTVVQLGRLGLGWITVAEISWLALSEDPRKQTDKFGVVVDIPRIHVLVGSLGRNST